MAKRKSKPSGTRQEFGIRMYPQKFGDCFVVTLPRDKGSPFRMMIDCGSYLDSKDAETRSRKIIEDISKSGSIDALVITHEHWDHVSGFLHAADRLTDLKVQDVWLAWTENQTDALARKLRTEHEKRVHALSSLVSLLDTLGLKQHPDLANLASLRDALAALHGYYGMDAPSAKSASGRKKSKDVRKALEIARGLSGRTPRFLEPGQASPRLEALSGFRFYVLGPPRDEQMLRKTDSKRATYPRLAAEMGVTSSLLAAAPVRLGRLATHKSGKPIAPNPAQVADDENYQPFDRVYRREFSHHAGVPDQTTPASAVRPRDMTSEFLERHYYGRAVGSSASDQSWRRIDHDWLGSAVDFALRLDSYTNNTSLALAIEIVATGDVLLFPGDAQVGSWLTWHDLKWKREDGTEITGRELIERTIFYKVGHHGSENATLRQEGLELMSSDRLAAFVPVDKVQQFRHIPLPSLMSALMQRTQERLVRADEGVTDQARAAFKRGLKSPNAWSLHCDTDGLWVEISMRLEH